MPEASRTGELIIGDFERGGEPVLPGPDARALAWSPSGDCLLYRSDKVRLWDGASSRDISDTLYRFGTLSPAGDRVALANLSDIALHDAASGELLERCQIAVIALGVAFSPDGRWLALPCHYRNVFVSDGHKRRALAGR